MLLTRRISITSISSPEVQELRDQLQKVQDGFAGHIVRLQQSVRKQTIENAELRQEFQHHLKKHKNLERRAGKQDKRLDEAESERKQLSDFIIILQNNIDSFQNGKTTPNSAAKSPANSPVNPYPSITSLNAKAAYSDYIALEKLWQAPNFGHF